MKSFSQSSKLRILILSYRSNPYCGGQGVYIRNLSHALIDLGHHVEVLTGPYPPVLNRNILLHHVPMLDLYNPENPFRMPTIKELLHPVNFLEWLDVSTMGYPEPFIFGIHAHRFLKRNYHRFDIVHDNQSLSYGVNTIKDMIPTVATVHHPITVDRNIAVRSARSFFNKVKLLRWYSFVNMQKRVVQKLSNLITVSKFSKGNIADAFHIKKEVISVVPNGIDTKAFYPIPEIPREKYRFIVTTSSDTPLKGLPHLLKAVAMLIQKFPIHLCIVGELKKKGQNHQLIQKLGIRKNITATGRIDAGQYVELYAKSYAAVIPSLYEGFGLPAGEAMACRVPVISTSGGALLEIVGEAGILVPPGDAAAIADAMEDLITHPEKATRLGQMGYERVHQHFSWKRAAQKTLSVYRKALDDHHRHHASSFKTSF